MDLPNGTWSVSAGGGGLSAGRRDRPTGETPLSDLSTLASDSTDANGNGMVNMADVANLHGRHRREKPTRLHRSIQATRNDPVTKASVEYTR
jgi:hypothetical protein